MQGKYKNGVDERLRIWLSITKLTSSRIGTPKINIVDVKKVVAVEDYDLDATQIMV